MILTRKEVKEILRLKRISERLPRKGKRLMIIAPIGSLSISFVKDGDETFRMDYLDNGKWLPFEAEKVNQEYPPYYMRGRGGNCPAP